MKEALQEIQTWIRQCPEGFNFLFLDIDNFRQRHLDLGTPSAKAQIAELVQTLEGLRSEGEESLWFGGDDFGVLSSQDSSALESLGISFNEKIKSLGLSCSGSIVSFPRFGKNPRELVQSANLFCSEAKLEGDSKILNIVRRDE